MNNPVFKPTPVLKVEGKNLPEVWETSLVELWENGTRIKTEYDKAGDEPSRDATMVMVITDPLSEPRLHLSLPCSFKDLEKYRREVVDGVHDHWINPEEGKWSYTYHQRLFTYDLSGKKIDQIGLALDKLAKVPYTRRAQAITWNVELDPKTDDPPCLQRLWFRCQEDDSGRLRLNVNAHWRSRDAYKAAFMNMFALTDLQSKIASELSEKAGREVVVGQYVDISDSYHIYGSYFQDFNARFLNAMKEREFFSPDIRRSRTVYTNDPRVQKEFNRATKELEKEAGAQK
jgi:thymidylate synthase